MKYSFGNYLISKTVRICKYTGKKNFLKIWNTSPKTEGWDMKLISYWWHFKSNSYFLLIVDGVLIWNIIWFSNPFEANPLFEDILRDLTMHQEDSAETPGQRSPSEGRENKVNYMITGDLEILSSDWLSLYLFSSDDEHYNFNTTGQKFG